MNAGGPRLTRGLLLVRADPARAAAWAASGLVAVQIAPLRDGWTALVPADGRAAPEAPYDDPIGMLLGRALPRALLGAIGVAQVGPRLVLCVVPKVLRPKHRWLVWEPGQGLIRVGALRPATVADLAATAGRRDCAPVLARVLREGRGDAIQTLRDTFEAAGLPGIEVATGELDAVDLPDVLRVDPKPTQVARFDRIAREDRRWQQEVHGQP